ncbi:MAG: MFS transporter [Candidatus Dormiibacterota bacterium]
MAAAPTTGTPRSARTLVVASLGGFVVLGLPDGMLGVAWPPLRAHFGQPLSGLGELLLASMAGYLLVAGSTGRVLRSFGTAAMLIGAALTAGIAATLIAAGPVWPAVVLAALLMGAASGGLDAALNTAVSLAGRPRWMNLLHASYGVGAALGPLLVTASLAVSSAWRGAYAVLGVFEIALVGAWTALRRSLPRVPRHPLIGKAADPATAPGVGRHRHHVVLGLSLSLFFVYTGFEAAAGAWSASFLRLPDGFSATLAGISVFLYWAGLTAGRFGVAALGSRLSAVAASRGGSLLSLAGATLLCWAPGPATTVAALVLIGAGLGPIFPALVTLTPQRLGADAAVHAVGWELGAAGVGGAGMSALVGVVLQTAGLRAFGPVLAALAVVVLCLNLLVERSAPGSPQPA